MSGEKRKFTYQEVKELMCDGCRLKTDEELIFRLENPWFHVVNGLRIPCKAANWRKIMDKLKPEDLE